MFDPKKAGEEADQMIAALNQPSAEEQEAATDAIAMDSAKAEPEQNTDQGVNSNPAPDNTDADVVSRLAEMQKELEASNQRWKVLQGMIGKKDEELESLRLMLAQLANKEEKPAEDQGAQPVEYVSKKDVEDYGTDLIDLIGRKAREVVAAELAQQLPKLMERFGKIESSVQSVEQTAAKSAQERFMAALATSVPDWEQVNVDPAFLGWLDEADPFTGVKKIELLRKAYTDMDARRTAAFFVEYKKANGIGTQESAEASTAPNLLKLASPGKSKSTTPAQEKQGRMWSRADISKLYDDKMAGRISHKEFAELERDLFKAQQDGRIAA